MPLEEVSPLPVSQLPQKPFSGKVELVFFAREAIKAKGIRVIQFAAFAKQRMLRLIRLKIKNKMKGHRLILILLLFLLGLHLRLTQPLLRVLGEKKLMLQVARLCISLSLLCVRYMMANYL